MTLLRRLIVFLTVLLAATAAWADVKPATLFSDHMVLQSGMSVPVWGTATAGAKVSVSINGQKASTAAAPDGKWLLRLAKLKPGGPYEMTVSGPNMVVIHDVLIGEVWLGSGQSNMAFTVSKKVAPYAGLLDEEHEIAAANYPQLRMFTGKAAKTYDPQATLEGEWQICTPENVPGFSAVGYLFGRNLNNELKVPVGIVLEAFGASTAEAWIPREPLAADPLLKPLLDKFDAAVKLYRETNTAKDPVQDQHQPTVLFNGMIQPVIPYAIRGVIWYQGESIVGGDSGVKLYPHVQATLIDTWRKLWKEGDFPFYIVQLAALGNRSNSPGVREAQASVLSLKNTGMAVTIDIGDPKDVHPHNKEPLGDRLSRLALANTYKQKLEFSGPVYQSLKIDGSAIKLKFTHVDGGLDAKGGPLRWFQIAGPDHKFLDATAAIDGDSVVVTNPGVKDPQAVRYAWANNPEGCNLYNSAGLPAAPFRTDKW